MTLFHGHRVGPRMAQVVVFVAQHMLRHGVSPREVAAFLGAGTPHSCGYAVVRRCVDAGLLYRIPDPRHPGHFWLGVGDQTGVSCRFPRGVATATNASTGVRLGNGGNDPTRAATTSSAPPPVRSTRPESFTHPVSTVPSVSR